MTGNGPPLPTSAEYWASCLPSSYGWYWRASLPSGFGSVGPGRGLLDPWFCAGQGRAALPLPVQSPPDQVVQPSLWSLHEPLRPRSCAPQNDWAGLPPSLVDSRGWWCSGSEGDVLMCLKLAGSPAGGDDLAQVVFRRGPSAPAPGRSP